MFVRFRKTASRLQVSLIETRREDGKVRHEHVASLGSIALALTIADRIEFWRRLFERFEKLSNRIDREQQVRLFGAIHARIPLGMSEEQRALQLENARAENSLWQGFHELYADRAAGHERLAASAAERAAADKAIADDAAARAKTAQERIEQIERVEAVDGGLGKPVDVRALMKQAGWSARDIEHARLLAAAISEENFHEFLEMAVRLDQKGKRRRELQAIRQIVAKYGWPDDGKA
jgi:hypothetical protein